MSSVLGFFVGEEENDDSHTESSHRSTDSTALEDVFVTAGLDMR